MRPNHSLRFACHLACTFFLLSILGSVSAQQGFYSEGFESETPADSANLCLPVDTGYVPADGNWSLGPACAVPTNGIPKLVNVEGDTYLEFNQKYPDGSEVWNSATINVEDVDNVLIRFDARGDGGLENTGPFRDSKASRSMRSPRLTFHCSARASAGHGQLISSCCWAISDRAIAMRRGAAVRPFPMVGMTMPR